MNKVILMGRLTRDPDLRYSTGERQMAIARYTLAVDRRGRSRSADGTEQTADFINCVAFAIVSVLFFTADENLLVAFIGVNVCFRFGIFARFFQATNKLCFIALVGMGMCFLNADQFG